MSLLSNSETLKQDFKLRKIQFSAQKLNFQIQALLFQETPDMLIRMIQKRKLSREQNPYGIDDKLLSFTQNNDFEN